MGLHGCDDSGLALLLVHVDGQIRGLSPEVWILLPEALDV